MQTRRNTDWEAANHRFDAVSCSNVTTASLISVTPDTDDQQVARLFRKHRTKCLPVVSASCAFSGIILQTDVIDALVSSELDLSLVGRGDQMTAVVIARPAGAATTVDIPVGQIRNRLSVQGAKTVPVMNGDRLAGIITRWHITRLLFRNAQERQIA